MSNKSLLEELSEEVIIKAIEHAASTVVGNAVKWGGFNSELQNAVKTRAISIMNTDPEVNALIKASIIAGVEAMKAPKPGR